MRAVETTKARRPGPAGLLPDTHYRHHRSAQCDLTVVPHKGYRIMHRFIMAHKKPFVSIDNSKSRLRPRFFSKSGREWDEEMIHG